jgi:hypothetical protein
MSQRLKLGAKSEIENMCVVFWCLTLCKTAPRSSRALNKIDYNTGEKVSLTGQGTRLPHATRALANRRKASGTLGTKGHQCYSKRIRGKGARHRA